jgi:hypothetical protein
MTAGVHPALILMATFCTLVAAAYLAMVPLAFRFLRIAPFREKQTNKTGKLPNYEAWKHVDIFTFDQAAHLWCDIDPDLNPTLDSAAWLRGLVAAWRKGDLRAVKQDGETMVTQGALKEFAKKYKYDPRFLRDA